MQALSRVSYGTTRDPSNLAVIGGSPQMVFIALVRQCYIVYTWLSSEAVLVGEQDADLFGLRAHHRARSALDGGGIVRCDRVRASPVAHR